jgi:hypothetical protein
MNTHLCACEKRIEVEIEDMQGGRQIVENFRVHRGGLYSFLSVKEVIQPQVPLRLPCYDFAPVTTLALGGLAPCGFLHRLRALAASMA